MMATPDPFGARVTCHTAVVHRDACLATMHDLKTEWSGRTSLKRPFLSQITGNRRYRPAMVCRALPPDPDSC